MATITGQQIVDRAEIILQDATNVRWPEEELTYWLNDAQRAIVLLKPDASAVNAAVLLVAGAKQTIPTSGVQLLDIIRNMGVDGSTPGRAITQVERRILDEQRPEWHTETASAVVKHYMFDERNPRNFYVYPQQPAVSPGYVEMLYSSTPADLATLASVISLDDIYAGPMLLYILSLAYSKDADLSPAAPQRAAAYSQGFTAALAGKVSAESLVDPDAYQMAKTQEAQAVGR